MITYRQATKMDSAALTLLAKSAKAYWGYPKQWIEEWDKDLTISADYIREHMVVILQNQKKMVGFFAMEQKRDVAYLSHLWVDPPMIGSGFGKCLFQKVCEEAVNQGYSTLELISDPNAEGFYRYFGAIKIGEIHSSIFGNSRILPKMQLKLSNLNSG